MGKKLKDLYDLLIEQELTDKTFKEFKAAIEDQPYRDKVYEVLSQRKLYDGEKEVFDDTYFFEYGSAAVEKKKRKNHWPTT